MITSTKTNSFRDLIVWQRAMQLCFCIYEVTKSFPDNEKYGLTNQMRRSSVSIPSNISEGYRRATKPDYNHFLRMAFGSTAELETQLEIARHQHYISGQAYTNVMSILVEVIKMLAVMTKKTLPSQN